MVRIELFPDLSHCIETVAKKEHANILKQLLTPGKVNNELEEKLEILRIFIGTADFKKLRSQYEKQLMECREVRFVVYLEDGASKYEMQIAST